MKLLLIIFGFGIFATGLVCGASLIALNLSLVPRAALIAPQAIDFNSFASVLLTAVAIIFAFLGVFVAVLAVFGFQTIKENVDGTCRNIINQSIKSGEFNQQIEETTIEEIKEALAAGGSLNTMATDIFQETVFRGVGLDESSGANDPMEER